MRYLSVVLILMVQLGLVGRSVAAAELRCEISEKHLCQPSADCTRVPAKVWNLIDLENRTYARCDNSGCDTYDALVSTSGVVTRVEVPGRGLTTTLTDGGSSFVEVATLVDTVYVSFGSCR